MKAIIYILNILTIVIIFNTTQSFHNDYTLFCDYLNIALVIVNLTIINFVKIAGCVWCVIISLLQVFYCTITTASDDEIEYKTLRISEFFKGIKVSDKLFFALEYLSGIIILIIITIEILFILNVLTRLYKSKLKPN
jgi:hypothetical protein